MKRPIILPQKKKKTHVGKGGAFERLVGEKLSLALSNGERKDYFARNVLSGGQFTRALKKSKLNHGQGGDLIGIHPEGQRFTAYYHIECKHYKSLDLHTLLFQTRFPGSFLKGVIAKAAEQAALEGKDWLLIVRQNGMPIICFLDASGRSLRGYCQQTLMVNGNLVYMILFDDFLLERTGYAPNNRSTPNGQST